MISPRLTEDEVVTGFAFLESFKIHDADPRLFHLDLARCRMGEGNGDGFFVSWPDGAIGFVIVQAWEDVDGAIIDAYTAARRSLEIMMLTLFHLGEEGAMQ